MELLERVEKEIKQRLEELRPAVEESKRLEDALRQLGRQVTSVATGRRRGRPPASAASAASAARTTSPTRTRARRSTAGRRRTRVSGEKRREQLVTLARENPDIKAREIADRLGTTPNNIYNLIRRLESEGTIERRDGRLIVK